MVAAEVAAAGAGEEVAGAEAVAEAGEAVAEGFRCT